MKVGIIIAMDIEYRAMVSALDGLTEGHFPDSHVEVVLRQCGIGKVNAAVGTMRLVEEQHPDCIVSTGLAGGVGEQVNVWDVVVAQQLAYHDVYCGMGCEQGQVQGLPARFACAPQLVEVASQACQMVDNAGSGSRTHRGLICTGDQFITRPEPVYTIQEHFPDVLACDMESAAIAQVCHLMQVPFLSIRTISDTPARTHDHAMQWEESLRIMSHDSFNRVKEFLRMLPASLNF